LIGKTLAHYEVAGLIGKGGMGEVYRARDTKLNRDVALKFLPDEVSRDPERLARFEREARLLASLSHSNIASIYGLEEVDGTRFLVLEFVEGETLADRLTRGPLPIDDAVEVAKQIATGLEAAHESGVVHRDLKPGNVMLTPSGAVKVLDFGLARSGATERSGSAPNLSASPTLTHAATQDGVILGTAAYMSPEQARGRAVDRRTDIWSFGCVLYECLTGRQAFEGETVSDLVARILEREPDWSTLPAATPIRLRTLLQRCLAKDARERLRDIGEARIALDAVSKGEAISEAEANAMKQPRRSVMLPIGLVIVTALVSVIATRLVSRPPSSPRVALSVMLPQGDRLDAGVENNILALAPGGRSLAYTAREKGTPRLFLRRLDRPESVEIPGTQGAHDPFFSPDGEWIGFFADRHLRKVSVRGGAPIDLAESGSDRGGVWLDDGSIVYSPTFASSLHRVGSNGGQPQEITTLDSTRSERSHRWPCALPGGEWVVFTVGVTNSPGSYEDANIDAVSLRTGERRKVAQGSCARYAPGGWLIVARGGSLYGMPVDPENPRGGATAVPVLDGVLGMKTSGIAFFDVARDGTLAFIRGREEHMASYLAWIDRSGNKTLVPGEPRDFLGFAVSPDGTQALVEIGPGGGNGDVFLVDLGGGSMNQITFNGHDGSPRWLPDGKHFAWARASDQGGDTIVMRSVLGGDSTRVLARSNLPLIVSDVAPDGGSILFQEYGSVDADVLQVATSGAEVRTLVKEPRSQTGGRLSPDGQWIAYVSNETGVTEVCVRPVGRAGGRVQISSGGGWTPRWSPDGHELYYAVGGAAGGALMATHMVVRDGAMFADETQRLFDLPFFGGDSSIRDYDVDSSGEKFLVRVPAGETNEMREIAVRLRWAASLRSLANGGRR
jgi:serine/threonine protein kinase/Tol biopolymer transport system component